MTVRTRAKFTCNQCGKVEERASKNQMPAGWMRLGLYADLCSWDCLAKYATRQEEAEKVQRAKREETWAC